MFDVDGPLAPFIWAFVILAAIDIMPWWGWIIIVVGGLLWLIFLVFNDAQLGTGSGVDSETKEPNYTPYANYPSETNYYINSDGTVLKGGEPIGYIDRNGAIYGYGKDGPDLRGYIDDYGNLRRLDGSACGDNIAASDRINDIGLMIERKK